MPRLSSQQHQTPQTNPSSVANALTGIRSTLKRISSVASLSSIRSGHTADHSLSLSQPSGLAPSTHDSFCRQIPTSTEILIPRNFDMSHILVDFGSEDMSDDSSSMSSSYWSSGTSLDTDSDEDTDDDISIEGTIASIYTNSMDGRANASNLSLHDSTRAVYTGRPKLGARGRPSNRSYRSTSSNTEEDANNPFASGFTFAINATEAHTRSSITPSKHEAPEDSPFSKIKFVASSNRSPSSPRRNTNRTFLPSSRLPLKGIRSAAFEIPDIFRSDSDSEEQESKDDIESSVGDVLKGNMSQEKLLAALQHIAKDIAEHAKY